MVTSNIENFIGVWNNAYTPEFCDIVIEYFDNIEQLGGISNRLMDENTDATLKDDEYYILDEYNIPLSHTRSLMPQFYDSFWMCYEEYVKKYSILKHSGNHNSYGVRLQKTKIGAGYHMWHYESCHRNVSHRLCAWMLYLNDVDEGGETEFLYLHKRIKPTKGTLIMWPAGYTHTHRGNPPLSNNKYIMTGWLEF